MCGITGIYNFDRSPAPSKLIEKMNSALQHRGPDGEGVWSEGHIAMGHCRLSVLDLSSAGKQPMVSSNGRYIISYNGEVYNFKELRSELEALNYQFYSRTDTEVVLHAFAEWGLDALPRFNGMFAFAIWDRKKLTLTLARDRYGIKPLYYTLANQNLVFASEIKSILIHPDISVRVDQDGLLEYFSFQNFISDHTLFSDIYLLPAGCCMTFNVKGEKHLLRYWDFQFENIASEISENEYLEELDYLFQQAVNRQLVSDVDIGAYLSGGMDSGSITAIAARKLQHIKSFTCGFDLHSASGMELSFDERQAAEHMSYLFKTEHYEMVLKSGDMESAMADLAYHIEEPRVGQSYPNYYIARLASKFGKVVLAGTGGDELFGGYPWRYYRGAVNHDNNHYLEKYFNYWHRMVQPNEMSQLFSPICGRLELNRPRDLMGELLKPQLTINSQPDDYVNASLYFEAKTFLHGLLVVEDKLSMAHGLETRVPFLDNDLVNFAMRTPVNLKLGNLGEVVKLNEHEPGERTKKYFNKTNDGKLILRKMMANYIPHSIIEKAKQGFSAPDASWFQGESIEYVKRTLLTNNTAIYNFLDKSFTQKLINQHLEGHANRRLLIWSLLSFSNWCDQYL